MTMETPMYIPERLLPVSIDGEEVGISNHLQDALYKCTYIYKEV
jgi:hypothetical protein